MKKTILLLSLTLCICVCSAQKSKLKSYYYWINQAELAICDSNYQKASNCYNKAFLYKAPFGRDASFAFKLNSNYVNNIPRACQCFHFLSQMGDKLEWFIDEIDTLKNADLWNRMKIITDTTRVTTNPEINRILEDMTKSDQYVRLHSELYDSNEAWEEAIRKADSINYESLKNLYATYPTLNEYTTGLSMDFIALYIHFRREGFCDPKSILYDEVMKGNVRANQYARIEDICMFDIIRDQDTHDIDRYGTTTHYFFSVDSVVFIIYPTNIKEINKARKKIFMSETWKDYAKKVQYVYCNETDFYFVPISSIYYSPEDAAKIISETTSKIDNGTVKGSYFVLPPNKR